MWRRILDFKTNIWFFILSFISLALMIASFFVPPTGVIDSSVLAAVGEIFAFSALGSVIKAIDLGLETKLTKGDSSIEIKK